MDIDYEKLKKLHYGDNTFISYLGIEITEIRKGYAEGKMKIRPEFCNPLGSVHGGCLFTLADTVGGYAALSHGEAATTMDAGYHYLAPAIEAKEILAVAEEVKHGKNVSVYDVCLYDDNKKLLGKGTFSFFHLKEQ